VWQGAGWSFSATYGAPGIGAERAGSEGSPEGDGQARRAVFGAQAPNRQRGAKSFTPRADARQKHWKSSEVPTDEKHQQTSTAPANVKKTHVRPKNENTLTEFPKTGEPKKTGES